MIKERLMVKAASQAESERLERERIEDEWALAETHEVEDIPNSIQHFF